MHHSTFLFYGAVVVLVLSLVSLLLLGCVALTPVVVAAVLAFVEADAEVVADAHVVVVVLGAYLVLFEAAVKLSFMLLSLFLLILLLLLL